MDDVLLDVAPDTLPETAALDEPHPPTRAETLRALACGELTIEMLQALMFGPDSCLNRPTHSHMLG